MIAKVDETVYIDVDQVSFVQGDYTNKQDSKWVTILVVGGQGCTVEGMAGKRILDSFLWKHANAVYDMREGRPSYKQTIKRGE